MALNQETTCLIISQIITPEYEIVLKKITGFSNSIDLTFSGIQASDGDGQHCRGVVKPLMKVRTANNKGRLASRTPTGMSVCFFQRR